MHSGDAPAVGNLNWDGTPDRDAPPSRRNRRSEPDEYPDDIWAPQDPSRPSRQQPGRQPPGRQPPGGGREPSSREPSSRQPPSREPSSRQPPDRPYQDRGPRDRDQPGPRQPDRGRPAYGRPPPERGAPEPPPRGRPPRSRANPEPTRPDDPASERMSRDGRVWFGPSTGRPTHDPWATDVPPRDPWAEEEQRTRPRPTFSDDRDEDDGAWGRARATWADGEDRRRPAPEPRRRGGRRATPPPQPPRPQRDPRGPGATPHETGRWSTSADRWVPRQRGSDEPDYSIGRYDDTSEIHRSDLRMGQGQVLDHDDWYEGHGAGWAPPPDDEHPTARSADWSERARVPPRGRARQAPDPRARQAPDPRADAPPAPDPRAYAPPAHDPRAYAAAAHDPRAYAPPAHDPRRIAEPAAPQPRGEGEDWDEDESGGYGLATLATLAWFLLPVIGFAGWAFLGPGDSEQADCVDGTCEPLQSAGFQLLLDVLPWLGGAIVLSLVVAVIIRWATTGWRAPTIGFAAAIVGGGVTTVLYSVIAGSSGGA